MKTLMGLVAAVGLVVAPVAGFCCPPRAVYQAQQTYNAPAVVVPVAAYVVPLVVPLYSASYTPIPESPVAAQAPAPEPPPAAVPAGNETAQAIRELAEELRRLRAEIEKSRGGEVPPPSAEATPVRPPDSPGVAMLRVACASCHTAGKDPKGALALFLADGSVSTLNPPQQRKVLSKVASGDMPKKSKPPLNDPQRKLIVQWVESLP